MKTMRVIPMVLMGAVILGSVGCNNQSVTEIRKDDYEIIESSIEILQSENSSDKTKEADETITPASKSNIGITSLNDLKSADESISDSGGTDVNIIDDTTNGQAVGARDTQEIPTSTPRLSGSSSSVPKPTATPKPTNTTIPKATVTPTPKPVVTDAPKPTVGTTATPKPTVKSTNTPTPKPTDKPTATPTSKPVATNTPKPTATSTPKPTVTPKPTNTPKPTATSTPRPTATPKPTSTPTPMPTATPTPEPTATPTPEPTATPTPEPDPDPVAAIVEVKYTVSGYDDDGNGDFVKVTFTRQYVVEPLSDTAYHSYNIYEYVDYELQEDIDGLYSEFYNAYPNAVVSGYGAYPGIIGFVDD